LELPWGKGRRRHRGAVGGRARYARYSEAAQDRGQLLALCDHGMGLRQSRHAFQSARSVEAARGLRGGSVYTKPQRHHRKQPCDGCKESAQGEDAEPRRLCGGPAAGRGTQKIKENYMNSKLYVVGTIAVLTFAQAPKSPPQPMGFFVTSAGPGKGA